MNSEDYRENSWRGQEFEPERLASQNQKHYQYAKIHSVDVSGEIGFYSLPISGA